MGRPLSPHKFIKRSFECWATSTKQPLDAGGGHQAPRKTAHSFQKEARWNIKDKKRDKSVREGDLSWGGSREAGGFQTEGNPLIGRSVGSLGISEGNISRKKKKKTTPQNRLLTTTPSEVAQMLAAATSELGLDREARAECLGYRTRPESPEDNLGELTWDSNPNCGIAERKIRELFRERLLPNTQPGPLTEQRIEWIPKES